MKRKQSRLTFSVIFRGEIQALLWTKDKRDPDSPTNSTLLELRKVYMVDITIFESISEIVLVDMIIVGEPQLKGEIFMTV